MDRLRFQEACNRIINNDRQRNSIGTLGEKTLHAVLKSYFEPFEDNHEIKIGNYVADIASEKGIIEIQTRNLNVLRKKLEAFLEYSNVTVVYPIPKIKYLSWIDLETGKKTKRRKSPKSGNIYDSFRELYKIKYTLDNPKMNICLVMLEVEEIRYLNGWSFDKKKGSTRYDRIPIDILDEVYLNCPNDYSVCIPDNLYDEFTSNDFAKHAKIRLKTAQTTLNVLSYLGVVTKCGKKGNSIIYRRAFDK